MLKSIAILARRDLLSHKKQFDDSARIVDILAHSSIVDFVSLGWVVGVEFVIGEYLSASPTSTMLGWLRYMVFPCVYACCLYCWSHDSVFGQVRR